MLEAIKHVAVAGVLQHLLEGIEIVLLVDQLHVRQEFASTSHQKRSASEQVPSSSHFAWIDIAHWKRAATHESSDLFAVDLVVFLLASVNGSHVERVAENELDAFVPTKIGEPVPGKHAFDANDQVVAKALDGVQAVVRLGPHVAMQSLLPLVIEDAQVHPLGVQIHAAIDSVLPVVESHHGPPWKGVFPAFEPLKGPSYLFRQEGL